MFAYLLVHPDGSTREQLRQALWPDASVAQAKNNVHVTLHHLRRALGRADLVLFDRDRYAINWSLGVEVDVTAFEREVEEARRALRANPGLTAAADRLRTALDRYRGDFLADEHAGDWHLSVRERLQRLRLAGLATLGTHLVAVGAHADAAEVYRRLVQLDEWDESAQRELMMALARSGQRGEALRQYERLAARLACEHDAEPTRETTAVYDRLRRGELGH